MLKCCSDRWVCGPHNLSAETSTAPRLSNSVRTSVILLSLCLATRSAQRRARASRSRHRTPPVPIERGRMRTSQPRGRPASRSLRDRKVESTEQVHDPVVVLLSDELTASDPVVNDRVVFFQQTLELTKFFSVEPCETLIRKGADQQISLGRTAAPCTEF